MSIAHSFTKKMDIDSTTIESGGAHPFAPQETAACLPDEQV